MECPVVAEHGDDRDPHRREQVAVALMKKSAVLAWELERPEEAIHVWDEVYRRYADAPEPALRESANAALWKKGLTLVELKQRSAALGVYREIAARRVPARGLFVQRAFAIAMVVWVTMRVVLKLSGPLGAVERWAWQVQDRETEKARAKGSEAT